MFKIQSTKQFAAAIVASGCLVLALGAHADPVGGTEPGARSMQTESAACKSARASAWFERQRARTDGDVDPTVPTPRECMTAQGASAAGKPAAGEQIVAKK
ncbi:MAG TPA: hypothetical protein VKR38_13455 [Usitatibacter sp.]|nr:hypothetical protein [Usitatibacter sp.]